MNTGRRALLIPAVFAVLALIWGTTWAGIRIGLEGIPPLSGVALRFAIASVLLFLLGRARGVPFGRAGRREKVLWLANAVFSFAVPYSVVYWAEQWVPSGLSSILFATYPLFVAWLSHVVIAGDRLTALKALGTLIGFAGVATIFSDDFGLLGGRQVAVASVVFLLSPLFSALGSVLVKRFGAGIHPLSITAVPMAITAVLVAPLALLFESSRRFVFDAVSVSMLLYLAIFGTAVTFSLYFWLLSQVTATKAALTAYLIPIVAVTVGAVFLDEPVTARTLGGAALVLAGVALTTRARARG